jgi:phosphoribosylformimino-5-aminoimidazole carboxamide ribotide isomerase
VTLIFPAIEITKECCMQLVRGLPGAQRTYSVDPVEMAIMWRGENAKTLHVVDLDGIAEGKVVHGDVIRRMVQAVDIPIQVGGGLRSFDEIRTVLDLGVFRVVIGTAAVEQPGLIEQLVREFGTRKIAIGVEVLDGKMIVDGGKRAIELPIMEFIRRMRDLGVTRIVYKQRGPEPAVPFLPYEELKQMAIETKLRFTSRGSISSYKELVRLQELERYGVDSVIVGKPLYDNQFPCQALWRINEDQLTDLGPTRRI